MAWHAGDVVRRLREQKGFATQAKFAERAKLSTATINRIESGKLATVERRTLDSVALALGTTWDEIEALVPAPTTSTLNVHETEQNGSTRAGSQASIVTEATPVEHALLKAVELLSPEQQAELLAIASEMIFRRWGKSGREHRDESA